MDILYIIGRGSKWNNKELLYSLRSIAKNGINVGRVFVAGYIPPFVNRKEVICVPVEDKTDTKHYNILHAIEEAVERTDIGCNDNGDFLYSSDDHFYIKPTDFAQYPFYWRGADLPANLSPDDKHKKYHTTLISTRKLLEAYDLPFYHFAWHGNTHFTTRLWNDEVFKRMRRLSYIMPEGCEPTCLMLNYWITRDDVQMKVRSDIKLGMYETRATFQTKVEGREVFSSVDNIQCSYMAEYLQTNFPDKCKYEV